MGNSSIAHRLHSEKEISSQDLDWERRSYQTGCNAARQDALRRLKEIDDKLFQKHPPSWEVKDLKKRTLLTQFGEITITRRLYEDKEGCYHFLLDEHLGLPPAQLATPSLQESLVELATQKPFRQVSRTLEKLTAGILSASTIYRLLQKTSHLAIEKEEEDWQALYERGELPPGGECQVPALYSEGDGVWIHLQREEQKHFEVKNAIAYEGWERLPQQTERYRLVNKRVYCHANEGIPFWEGANLEWSRKWDLSYLKKIVIGGDGANWIDAGIGEFPRAIRQLDGFHLARACGRGWQEGSAIYEAIRGGEIEEACSLMKSLIPREGKGTEKARRYVKRNLKKGKDWRTYGEAEGRGLGSMESNEDKLVANRMKKRGLSWKVEGALRMHKAIQLAANGGIKPFCMRLRPTERGEVISPPARTQIHSDVHQRWLEATLPALAGPHPSRPWVQKLRNIAHAPYPLT